MNKYKDFRNEHKGPGVHHILLSIQDDVDGATGDIGTSTNIRGTGTQVMNFGVLVEEDAESGEIRWNWHAWRKNAPKFCKK